MSERKIVTMFTWNGKKYTVDVDAAQYKSAVKDFGSVEAVYDILTGILHKQRDPDTGELKYPELQPMPEITDADREADHRWFNERLRDPDFAMWHGRLGEELSPSDMKIQEWKDKYPEAVEFHSDMVKYASVQGATYGLHDPGDIKAYKYFAHKNPGTAYGTEFATSLPTSFGLTGLTRFIAPKVASLAWPSVAEAIPKSASAGKKFVRVMRNMGLAGAETMAHMFGWRLGHTEPEDPEEPWAAERWKQAAVGDHALRDYSLAFGLGGAIPGVAATGKGTMNMFKNISRRTGGDQGSYDLMIQRASKLWDDSVPLYAKEGISEDAMWGALHNQLVKEKGDIVSAVVQTQKNIMNILENRGAPAFQDLPLSRMVGDATGKAPLEATIALKDRIAELAQQNRRIRGDLLEVGGRQTPSEGVLLDDPEGSARTIIRGHKTRGKDFYKDLEEPGIVIRRDTVAEFITPGGLGDEGAGFIDRAWNDTIRELDKILATRASRDQYIKNYGRLPRTLLPRDEFLASSTAVLDPLVAQMISQNAKKYAQFSTEALAGRTVKGGPTFRESSAATAEARAFDEAIGNEIPGYRLGNEAYSEAAFIQDALDSSKKMGGLLDETGKGYDTFNTWLKEWEALNGRSVSIGAKDDAMRIFLSRSALDLIPPNATPRMILDSPQAQQRIRAFIGDDEQYTNFMNRLVDEQVAQEVTESLPAATSQLMSRGTTGTEQALASPSMLEQAPHTAALLAFSPAFAGGRLGSQRLAKLKGLESEAVAKQAVNTMLSRDPSVRAKFVTDLQAGVADLRSPIGIGSQASLATGTIPPVIMEEDFDIYGMPKRDKKKELQFLLDKLWQPRVY